jgi:hypothetical protein
MDLWLQPNTPSTTAQEVKMPNAITLLLTEAERDQLVRSLVLHQASNPAITQTVPLLAEITAKLASAGEGPNITIGVHGGLVQWVMGNPFPIRICDYDGDDNELPATDEQDQRCHMWFEDVDSDWHIRLWNTRPTIELNQPVPPSTDKI